jgi:choline dehydrogenase-like flavoprotein
VALVDAGRPQLDKNFSEHVPVFALKYRTRAPEAISKTRFIQQKCGALMERNYDWFCDDLKEPYTASKDKPFLWMGRLRITGGRTNVWGRQSYRLSEAASHDGYGEDWPLSYKDLAPYYDLIEEYVGITGIAIAEGVYELPDGKFHPPMALTCAEVLFRNRVKEKVTWTVTLGRSANITRAINGRAPCHYCGPCERGCVTHSYFNSAFTTVADALRTGNCTHIPKAMVYRVLMDAERNRAKGVLYIDRITHELNEVHGRVVVLCAQSLESVRILFNSANRQYPNGLANSSGVMGHYLMDHVMGGGGSGQIPALGGRPSLNGPRRPNGIYVIRFRNTHNQPQSKKFLRGYGFQGGGGVDFNWSAPGFGEAYKKALQEPVTTIGVIGFGECLPRWDNYVRIDPNLVDVFGIPVLNVHMIHGENELALAKTWPNRRVRCWKQSAQKTLASTVRPGRPVTRSTKEELLAWAVIPGSQCSINFSRLTISKAFLSWTGSGFVSSACQNPTLTIMALCVRSCDYLMAELKRGNI